MARLTFVIAVLAGIQAGSASADDPGLWVKTNQRTVPAWYRQGLASDPVSHDVFFSGSFAGLYRTNNLVEKLRNTDPVPKDVFDREKYNHIGDIAWDAAEGGRLLLPMESYAPFGPDTNPSHNGSVGVMDAKTLRWKYYVKLDPAEIEKAMWFAIDPDRGLLWTQKDFDVLGYSLADINPANAAPNAAPIHSVRRLVGVTRPTGAGGAVVYGGRLFLSTLQNGFNRVVSVDPNTGSSQVEIEIPGDLEEEGLDVGAYLGGLLHWELVPGAGLSNTQLLSFVPKGAKLRVKLSKSRIRARKRTTVTATATVVGQRTAIGIKGVQVRVGGKTARTNSNGRARLKLRLGRGSYRVQAFLAGLRSGTRTLRVI